MDFDLPEHLNGGTLRLKDVLGWGGQGVVVRAHDRALNTDVAVKLVPTKASSPRFDAEAKVLTRMDHPHLVKVREVGTEQDFDWFSMRLLEGGTVSGRLRDQGPLSTDRALRMAFDVTCGVAALHHAGIIHRDVKPQNIFFDLDGRAVLGDLGIARMPPKSVAYRTGTGASLGSIGYSSPEQEIDASTVDPSSDQYGLGATLYNALTNRRPVSLFDPEGIDGVLDGLPQATIPLILRACDYAPQLRFPDARALALALAHVRDHEVGGPPQAEEWMAWFDEVSPPPMPWTRIARWLGLDP